MKEGNISVVVANLHKGFLFSKTELRDMGRMEVAEDFLLIPPPPEHPAGSRKHNVFQSSNWMFIDSGSHKQRF